MDCQASRYRINIFRSNLSGFNSGAEPCRFLFKLFKACVVVPEFQFHKIERSFIKGNCTLQDEAVIPNEENRLG